VLRTAVAYQINSHRQINTVADNAMPMFENREHAYEAKFAQDEELKFKARVRCGALVGHWAAGKLGLTGAAAETYVNEVVAAVLATPDSDELFRRIRQDFKLNFVALSDHRIHRAIDEFMARALAEVSAGK
jgi:hypothetical protein